MHMFHHTRRGFTQPNEYNWVGQALPDNAPVKGHTSAFIVGKNGLCCQVKPDLHSRRGFALRPSPSRPCGRLYRITARGFSLRRHPELDSGSRRSMKKEESLNKSSFRAPLRSGFTLIELLVVVLIIGILAAVALPQYQKIVEMNEAKMILANMYAVKKMENIYRLQNGTYTYNWEELDVIPAATEISANKKDLYAADGRLYALDEQGTFPHVLGTPRDLSYVLYLAFPAKTQLCFPLGSTKGKRVCKYLGCVADQLDKTNCSFTWKP